MLTFIPDEKPPSAVPFAECNEGAASFDSTAASGAGSNLSLLLQSRVRPSQGGSALIAAGSKRWGNFGSSTGVVCLVGTWPCPNPSHGGGPVKSATLVSVSVQTVNDDDDAGGKDDDDAAVSVCILSSPNNGARHDSSLSRQSWHHYYYIATFPAWA